VHLVLSGQNFVNRSSSSAARLTDLRVSQHSCHRIGDRPLSKRSLERPRRRTQRQMLLAQARQGRKDRQFCPDLLRQSAQNGHSWRSLLPGKALTAAGGQSEGGPHRLDCHYGRSRRRPESTPNKLTRLTTRARPGRDGLPEWTRYPLHTTLFNKQARDAGMPGRRSAPSKPVDHDQHGLIYRSRRC
jgi:hypothetical protein